jgi:hypothetical protein
VTATSVPCTNCSISASVPYEKHATMAPGSSAGSRTTEHPRADPPRAGLTTRGSPSRSTSVAITVEAPASRNVSAGSVTARGELIPARPTTALATGLSKASRQASGRAPT